MSALEDKGGFLDVFQRNCRRIFLGTRLTGRKQQALRKIWIYPISQGYKMRNF